MTVKVRTADLRGYVKLLNRNAEANDQVLAYLRQWCGQEMQAVSSEGLLAKALNFHDRIYDDAVTLVTQLGQALRGSAAELEKAAKLYDGSDEAAKQRFESSQYVANGTPQREGWEAGHSGYGDYMNPLDPVSGGTPSYTEFKDPTKFLDKIAEVSMTGMIMNFIEEATGTNPLQKIVEFLTGDWEAYSRTAGAWRAIGEALERIGKNIDRGLASLDHAWDGGASEAAYQSFQALADIFKGMYARFMEVHEAYEQFAQFAMHTASVLVDTLKMVIDLAIIAIAKRKGVFGDAMAAFYMVKIVKWVGWIGWTMLTARGTIATIFGAMAGGGSSPLRGVGVMRYDASGI